jgi:predicted nuclease of restriction endonuclease-like (RecB) superfamily
VPDLLGSIYEMTSRIFELSWSHYLKLMRIKNEQERNFYEIECIANNWSLKELQRQFDSALYERLALSRDKEGVRHLAEKG